jgi:hypothetical protein
LLADAAGMGGCSPQVSAKPCFRSFRQCWCRTSITFLLLCTLVACAGISEHQPASQSLKVSVSPAQAAVQTGATQQFSATVTGGGNSAVQWSVAGILAGNASVGTISTNGLYTAPSVAPANGNVSITATSLLDSSASGSASVQIQSAQSISVSISPQAVTLAPGQSQQFTATVQGTASSGVTWLVAGIQGGNSSLGTVSTNGLYTAPAVIPAPSTVMLTARSILDPSSETEASITVESCGPPAYPCSRTDEKVTQPDAGSAISFGGIRGANTTVIDPIYNNVKMVRCTDANTDSSNISVSYYAGLGGSAEKNIWNVDDTAVLVSNLSGANIFERFNPSTYTCSPITASGAGLFYVNGGVFSKADRAGGPYTYYDFQWPTPFQVSEISIPASGVPSIESVVADFSPALYQTGVPAWPGPSQTVSVGQVINPVDDNPNVYLFQAIAPGQTGAAEPDWNSTVTAFQQTQTGGSSKITDGTVTWKNVGHATSDSPYVDVGGVEVGDRYIAESVSLDGGQDSGTWTMVYDRSANVIYQYNTFSGIETDFTCQRGNGYSCAGGAWVASVVNTAPFSDHFLWHENQLALDGRHLILVMSYCLQCNSSGSYPDVWQPGSATVNEMVPYGEGHMATGFSHIANQDGANDYYAVRAYSDLSNYTALWQPNPCTNTNDAVPPYPDPPCYPVFDTHLSWIFNKGEDQEPIIGVGDVGAMYVNEYPSVSPWQYEVIGISSCGTSSDQAACPSGYPSDTVWRFARTFNFGTEVSHTGTGNFYSAISSGTVSQSGRFYALTTTGNGTMGATNGASNCAGGYSWSPGFFYEAGRQITPVDFPVNGSSYNNPALFTFRTSSACTSGSSEPSWSQDGITPVPDSTCTWIPAGIADCRSDVVIVGLE